jgi:hypothetical protein
MKATWDQDGWCQGPDAKIAGLLAGRLPKTAIIQAVALTEKSIKVIFFV